MKHFDFALKLYALFYDCFTLALWFISRYLKFYTNFISIIFLDGDDLYNQPHSL